MSGYLSDPPESLRKMQSKVAAAERARLLGMPEQQVLSKTPTPPAWSPGQPNRRSRRRAEKLARRK